MSLQRHPKLPPEESLSSQDQRTIEPFVRQPDHGWLFPAYTDLGDVVEVATS